SINGTPNCLFKNYDTANEKVGTAKTDYSAAMFEAFKYFGGYTDPAHAQADTAGTPTGWSTFGVQRYSGVDPTNSTIDSTLFGKSDAAAYTDAAKLNYNPPVTSANSCAKNYIIFIGNGFPTQDSPSTLLTGVHGDATQLSMPQFTTVSTTQTAIIGASCGSNVNNCTSGIPQSLKDANPADSYACIGSGTTDATVCPGRNNLKFSVQSSKLVNTVTPTGTSAVPPTSDVRYTDEWAKYLFTTDASSPLGQQNIRTYTIDVFKDQQDSKQTALLYNMAKVGGGRYYQATSESAILSALQEILVEIQAENSVFAAAALPVSATQRAQNVNQVFFGMFRPDGDGKPRWYGNLKRYQVKKNDAGVLILGDKNGDDSIAATGFFQACATSYWTTDSGTYWNFAPSAAGQCTLAATGVYSDMPDGPLVEKGGAAEVLRKGNNPGTDTYTVNRTMYTCTDISSCPTTSGTSGMVAFNTTNVTQTALGASDATDQARIVGYTQGKDVGKVGSVYGDENMNGSTTDTRPSIHGDIVHARPLPVDYSDSTAFSIPSGVSPYVVAYYGTNDGAFRAVRTDNGTELWSFVAPEHFTSLKRLTENSPLISYPNQISGITPTPEPKSYFFDGTAGLYQTVNSTTVWIFPTMRRGGRMVYAFDVTNPTTPRLKWRFGCPNMNDDTNCTVDKSPSDETAVIQVGQTWSVPAVARIKGYSSGTAPVIVMGGGYDACQDDKDSATPTACASTKGRRIYVMNADTGVIIKSFETLRSVPSDVALMDRDFDGMVDYAYVGDTGGNLYRIDFVNGDGTPRNSDDWTLRRIANVSASSGQGRRFLFPPSVLYAGGKAYLTIGSGDRERPLLANYPYVQDVYNRFYMFVDTPSVTADPVDLDSSALADNTSGTPTCITPTSTLHGWRFDLRVDDNHRGEQVVTSSLISGGRVFFNTHQASTPPPNQCGADLGIARGYNVNLLCGDRYSVQYSGIGLAISPVQGSITLPGGEAVTFVLGGASDPTTTSPFPPGKIAPAISQKRSRQYWYRHGDK
ncbi:MAG TPA: PilC/PilY family type IV pilus protein, partial [Burkholderiales bacterium]|nr:PilC/PilY family type IV pilus protein [Burkholderiales bacterium]